MKRIIFLSIVLFICFITFSPRPQINASETETVKVDKTYLDTKDRQSVNQYGLLVFRQTEMDREFASLTMAVIRVESNFDTDAKSYKGAIGLMQLMPATAFDMGKELGIDLKEDDLVNPDINIRLGVAYIKYLQNKLEDIEDDDRKLALILASYNSGLHRVKHSFRCRGFDCYIKRANLCDHNQFNNNLNTLPEETKEYLKNVKSYYKMYRKVFNST